MAAHCRVEKRTSTAGCAAKIDGRTSSGYLTTSSGRLGSPQYANLTGYFEPSQHALVQLSDAVHGVRDWVALNKDNAQRLQLVSSRFTDFCTCKLGESTCVYIASKTCRFYVQVTRSKRQSSK